MKNFVNIGALKGKTIEKIDHDEDHATFYTDKGEVYEMYHDQNCCETVYLEDICGDIDDIIGSPILMAEEITDHNYPAPDCVLYEPRSKMWTFYKLGTINGVVTLRWYGESNGYYSEDVSIYRVK